ncbi:MAG: carbon-nitrogen hydrolase family protein [Gemmatimonadota bacterium]|nr:carbon-nitrogen hydrolase family protein [Gemmatimonadota bacterium]
MKIALIQLSCSEDRNENLRRALEGMDRAKAAGAALACFPELAIDQFFPQYESTDAKSIAETVPGPAADQIAAKAKEHSMVTVFNLYEDGGDGRYFDSSPVFDADGTLLGVTRMVHITDYACFHEKAYYDPGDNGAPVYDTAVGKIGVAICYDRHYPEYMRALGAAGAELVVIPQAGSVGEWPEGVYEAEVQTAAFQNGYFAALCNRVGKEERLTFAGESFVVDPSGKVIAQAKQSEDDLLVVDIDVKECATSNARVLFWRDRRPELYCNWLT